METRRLAPGPALLLNSALGPPHSPGVPAVRCVSPAERSANAGPLPSQSFLTAPQPDASSQV